MPCVLGAKHYDGQMTFEPDYMKETDWGIVWAELFANFVVVTGCFFPVKLQGTGSNAHFESDAAKLCPWSRKSLADQSVCFQRAFGALKTLTGDDWCGFLISSQTRSHR